MIFYGIIWQSVLFFVHWYFVLDTCTYSHLVHQSQSCSNAYTFPMIFHIIFSHFPKAKLASFVLVDWLRGFFFLAAALVLLSLVSMLFSDAVAVLWSDLFLFLSSLLSVDSFALSCHSYRYTDHPFFMTFLCPSSKLKSANKIPIILWINHYCFQYWNISVTYGKLPTYYDELPNMFWCLF